MRQFPTVGSWGSQHRVGIVIPAARAASRIVLPSATVTDRPSIVNVGMTVGLWPETAAARNAVASCFRGAEPIRQGLTAMNQRLPLRGPRLTCQPL